MRPGPRNGLTDVAGLLVGQSADAAAATGVTVVTAGAPFVAGVSVMGGAPGTRETDLLAPDKLVAEVDAIVLAGGSVFGLDAAGGVARALAAAGRGYRAGPVRAPIVPAAILFDLTYPEPKDGAAIDYGALGRDAYLAAGEEIALGSVGAGTGATAGPEKGGIGAASLVLASGVTVAALVAVNSHGSVRVPGGRHFWAAPFEIGGEFGGLGPAPRAPAPGVTFTTKMGAAGARGATTLGVVATDAALDKAGATRMAVAAQDGIARAIVPAHTPFDGDLVFGVSTGARAPVGPEEAAAIGHAASLCLARAIVRGCAAAAG